MPIAAYVVSLGAMTFAGLVALTVFYTVDHLDPTEAPVTEEPVRERVAV
jgi:hypothetical protein